MASPKNRAGFSLVEVVLAIGIIAFCLVAVVGLFSVGQLASQRATDDTSLAAASFQVISKIRSRTNSALPTNYFFDLQGRMVPSIDEASYVCEVVSSAVPETEVANISTNLARVKIQFTWPASVPQGRRPNTNTFYAALSQP